MKYFSNSWRPVVGWLVLIVSLLALVAAVPLTRGHSQSTVLAVVPHPDDEFQFWSVIEGRADEYKVFVSLTRGEQTGFCGPDSLESAWQEDLGELPPNPLPDGKWSRSCEEARAASLLGFLGQMSETDPTIPGNFSKRNTYQLSADSDVSLCREDQVDSDGTSQVTCDQPSNREVWVWEDDADRGAVVMFNLGDGDLTEEESVWAIDGVLSNLEQWGLAQDAPVKSMVGAFSNFSSDRCFTYPHGDHYAVELALFNHDFGVGPQIGATCFRDPRRSFTAVVSAQSVEAAFALGENGERVGAHNRHYGWLHAQVYPLAMWRQSALFHRVQSFWVMNAS